MIDTPRTCPSQHRFSRLVAGIAAVGLLAGCATYKPAPTSYEPQYERAQTQTNGPIIASVSVLSRSEAKKMFDLPLHKKEIQPVWLRLQNTSTNFYYFIPATLDPNYFSPAEVAYMHRRFLQFKNNRRLTEFMESKELENRLGPLETNEGFVFSNYDPGAKHVRLDLAGDAEYHRMEFVLPIPGRRYDFQRVDFDNLYADEEVVDYNVEDFLSQLESLPETTTDKRGTGRGDPVNLIVVARKAGDLDAAFLRQNWDLTEAHSFANVFRLIGSGLFKSRWRTSPVSSLYLFGRRQDTALQKARGTIHERNHLRLWLAPYTFEGRLVFVGQISRDIGLRFTFKAPGFFTHKIDPDTDEARNYLGQEVLSSGSVEEIAVVGGVGERTREEPGRNGTGDPWFTDGRRIVLFLSERQIPPEDVRFIERMSSTEPTGSVENQPEHTPPGQSRTP